MRFTIKLGAAVAAGGAAAALGLASLSQPGQAAAQVLPGGRWGPAAAVDLSGLPPAGMQLDGGNIDAVSCVSPGNCGAVGTFYTYSPAKGDIPSPFVLTETDGTWGTPADVAGISGGSPAQYGPAVTISCAAPGECAASWSYVDTNGTSHHYLIAESGGTWGPAQPETTGLSDISCPTAGQCAAVGNQGGLPMVMDSSAGTWGAPQQVAGVAALSSPPPDSANLTSVSCPSAGNCIAGGWYTFASPGGSRHNQPFLAAETDGTWGQAQAVPGMTTLNPADQASLSSVSCSGPGDCAAAGNYATLTGGTYSWVAGESGGSWGPAQQLPAPAPATRTAAGPLSCTGGFCAIAGSYTTAASPAWKAFTATSTGGAWTAQDVPGITADLSRADMVSCGAPGYCTVAGFYYPPGSGQDRVFLANDVRGTWASAQDVAALTTGAPGISGLSCTTPGYCTAAGLAGGRTYTLTEATAAAVTLHASAPAVTYGAEQAETLTATVTSPAGGTPAGTVTVTDGKLPACRITLTGGTGTCTLPPAALPAGTSQLLAAYSGDASYTTALTTAAVTVTKGATTAAITITPATVPFGPDDGTAISVTVTPQYGGTPAGDVFVYQDGQPLCGLGLTGGTGTCYMPDGQAGGRYSITASYGGDGNFTGSTAPARYFTVTRAKTSTRLVLSRATVTFGHETAGKLTVTVSSPVSYGPSGKVTIKTGRTTICVITLKQGRTGGASAGSCTLKARQMRPGRYRITASYHGDRNYAPSRSAARYLKVVR